MVADFRKQGYRRAWIGTEPGNIASQRGILGAGFTKVASINASRRAPGDLLPEVYGLPGVPEELVRHAAWSFSGEIIDVPDAI
jgi:hypothetical protein